MKKQFGFLLISASLLAASCGGGDKKQEGDKKETTASTATAKNFNAEATAAPGTVISELSFTEKDGDKEKAGKRITMLFEDTAKIVVTVFKKANEEVYDLSSFTINKTDAKALKADLTPMNDGSDNYTTYNPKDFGAVSLVFVADGGTADTKIVSVKNYSIFMDEKKVADTKENGFNMPVADFKTADEWVKKLAVSFKK
jgi:hypothetical protein